MESRGVEQEWRRTVNLCTSDWNNGSGQFVVLRHHKCPCFGVHSLHTCVYV